MLRAAGKKKSDTGGEPHLHTAVSGSQTRGLQEGVVNNTKLMVIQRNASVKQGWGNVLYVKRGKVGKKGGIK